MQRDKKRIITNKWKWFIKDKESYPLPWSWRHRRCPAGGPPLFSPWWPGGQWRPSHPPPPPPPAPGSPRRTRWSPTVTTSSQDVGKLHCTLKNAGLYEIHTMNTYIFFKSTFGRKRDGYEKCIFIIVSCDLVKRTVAPRYKLPWLLSFLVCIQFSQIAPFRR